MKNVIGVAAPNSCNGALIARDRVNAPTVGALAYPLRELVARGFGTQAFEGTFVAFGEHPPTGLAFGAVLAHQHRPIVREVPPRDGTLGLRFLRWFLEVDAARLRKVKHDAQIV